MNLSDLLLLLLLLFASLSTVLLVLIVLSIIRGIQRRFVLGAVWETLFTFTGRFWNIINWSGITRFIWDEQTWQWSKHWNQLLLGSTGSDVSLSASLPLHTSVSDRPQRAVALCLCFNESRFIYCTALCLCTYIILNCSDTSITEILLVLLIFRFLFLNV